MSNEYAKIDAVIDAAIDEAEEFKRKYGRYTPEEAAAFISERTGEDAKVLKNKIMDAIRRGEILTYGPFSTIKKDSGIIRDFFEHVYWNDLNDWLKKNEPRLDFQF